MPEYTSIAEDYLLAGISVVPVTDKKRPPFKWEQFQHRPIESTECDRLFGDCWGIGAICGRVSGGLEIIDFDAHSKDIETVYAEFNGNEGVGFILERYNPPIERSPRGGYHMAYRYESDRYDGNMKLANWPGGESMIETRGEGGLCVVSPSPKYELISGSFTDIPTITRDERDYLIAVARSLNKAKQQVEQVDTKGFDNTDPVSYFNWNCAQYAKNLLIDKGWKKLDKTDKDGLEYWKRPGKEEDEQSATWGKKHNALYVFSSSAEPFKSECYYTPFQILVRLRFGGSYNAAISWVVHKYFNEEIPYIRIGIDYFKKITKTDRFGIDRIELKPWKKDEIKQDHGKTMVDYVPKFDDFTIVPDNISHSPIVHNCYNLYREFPHRPSPGKWEWTEILMRHVFGEQYDLGLRYLQILYLHPNRLMPILVLVSRERQTGKTTFINWLSMVFGDNMANISPDDLVNGFNSTYAASNIISVEETLIEKAITVEKIKALATQKFISVNQKFVSQYRMPFFGKIILTSNNEDKFARIDDEEIRFFIRKLGLPKFKNHRIEDDLLGEIPAFLHYLTTLPPLDFTNDRSGFTPEELANESLQDVKTESKSGLYKGLFMLIEDLFMNELSQDNEFYADTKSIYDKWFSRDGKVDMAYLRSVLKNEFKLEPTATPIYVTMFNDGMPKTARPYLFKREMFTKHGIKPKQDEIPF